MGLSEDCTCVKATFKYEKINQKTQNKSKVVFKEDETLKEACLLGDL